MKICTDNMKTCSKCKEEKADTEFYKDRSKKRGLQSQCKDCKQEDPEYQQTYQQSYRPKYHQSAAGKAAFRRGSKKYRDSNPEKCRARAIAGRAIRAGELERSIFCEECGLPKEIQAHHKDYSKPLDVDWLCRECHTVADRLLREGVTAQTA